MFPDKPKEEQKKKRKGKMNNEDNQTLHGVNGNTSGTYRPLYPARTPALNTYLTLCFWFL